VKFNVDAKQLAAAFAAASKVKPSVPKGAEGFLISVCSDGPSYIYSRDRTCVVRVPLQVIDVDGSVDCVYPASAVGAFKYLSGQLTFEVTPAGNEGARVRYYRYNDPDGVEGEWLTPNPKLVAKCEADMSEAIMVEYPAALLRVALGTVKDYAAGKDTDVDGHEHFRTVQVFDASKPEWAKGDGVLFAANRIQAAYFECPLFKGKHFSLAAEYIPLVVTFLGDISGTVRVHNSPHMVFFEGDGGHILGILHRVHTHPKYAYYSLDKDTFVFGVDRDVVLNALRYMREEMASKASGKKIRLVYDHERVALVLQKLESYSKARSDKVPVKVKEIAENKSFTTYVNIDHMVGLFEGAVCNEVELRVAIIKELDGREVAAFRTIDPAIYSPDGKPAVDKEGAVECKVTRFMPSME
jgi:hypothetical protein